MYRTSLKVALAACVIAAVGCSGGGAEQQTGATGARGIPGQPYTLSVARPVGGTVTSDDAKISCGTVANDCTEIYVATTSGPVVTLTAAADAGYTFKGWGGDCTGATTCALNILEGADRYAVAVFQSDAAVPQPPPSDVTGRVYGLVTDQAGAPVAGITVSINTYPTPLASPPGEWTFKSMAGTGEWVADFVPPGTYQVTARDAASPALYDAPAPVVVTLPEPTDPSCQKTFGIGGEATFGCLVKQDFTVTRNAYVNPVAVAAKGFIGAATPAKAVYVAGFGAAVNLTCEIGAADTFVQWTQTAGPTVISTAGWGQAASFTTPTFADLVARSAAAATDTANCPNGAGNKKPNKVGCGISNLVLENRPVFNSFNKQQAGEATYTFTCKASQPNPAGGTFTATAAATVQLFSFVNANVGNHMAAGAVFTARAQVPTGSIVVADDVAGRASYNWKFVDCTVPRGSPAILPPNCPDPVLSTIQTAAPSATVPVIVDANTANPWFVVTNPGYTLTLTNDANVNMPIRGGNWIGQSNSCSVAKDATSLCHTTGVALEPVLEWQESRHARVVQEGMSGPDYTTSCVTCHALGNDPGIANGGWDEVAASLGYTIPASPFLPAVSGAQMNQYGDMPAALQAVSNIQCENCHGPGNGLTTGSKTAHTASMSSKVCAYCHDGGKHGIYSQWRQSMHANLAGAQAEGPAHGADQSHCARCHYAQGFVLYDDALLGGNPDKFGTAGTVTVAAPVGVTVDNVDAITCQTCHSPHSLELRVTSGSSPMLLASGFSIANAGAGGLCAGCHNTRNGIVGGTATVAGVARQHNDATGLTEAVFGSSTTTSGHAASQADVYFGGNGYLLGAVPAQANLHADPNWFADACVDCHVKAFNASAKASGTLVNHNFGVDANTCTACHGSTGFLALRQNAFAQKVAQYEMSLTSVLQGAGITAIGNKAVEKKPAAGAVSKAAGSSLVTVTSTAHGLADGSQITILNGETRKSTTVTNPDGTTTTTVTGPFMYGTFTITVVDANTFTYDDALVNAETVAVANAGALTVIPMVSVASNPIAAVVPAGERPMLLAVTLADGSVYNTYFDAVVNGTTPVLYSVDSTKSIGKQKVYGNVAKSVYNFFLMELDGSEGIHNMAFTDALFHGMIEHLDSGTAVK